MTRMLKKTKTISQLQLAICAIAVIAMFTGVSPIFATHVSGVADYEWHIWSRSSSDGHLSYLNCGTGSNSDNCDLKIKTLSSVSSTGLTQTQINTETDQVITRVDALNKKMSLDRVTTSDSYITSVDLGAGTTGRTDYELHCSNPQWWGCAGQDMHFTKMMVKLNTGSRIIWGTTESASCPSGIPTTYDVEKTLGHELFHAMGIDHNSSSTSIVYYTYVCGSTNGYNPNTTDINDLAARYP